MLNIQMEVIKWLIWYKEASLIKSIAINNYYK